MFDIINVPLGYLFRYIYMLLENYGWTLVVFTLVTKLILLPLTVKQQKSMAKMQAVQPKIQALQKKYEYDKEKLNQEMVKIYQENNINPMSGCLPLLIQLPVLFALYYIIRSPLTYVVQLGKHGLPAISEVHAALTQLGSTVAVNDQIGIAAEMSRLAEGLATKFPGVEFLQLDFSFFGLNLSETISKIPNFLSSPLIIIPILAGLTTYLSSKISTKFSNQSGQKNGAADSMKGMMAFMPFMTAFFAFTLPAGLGVYWIASNVVQTIQQIVLYRMFPAETPETPAPKHYREREAERRKK